MRVQITGPHRSWPGSNDLAAKMPVARWGWFIVALLVWLLGSSPSLAQSEPASKTIETTGTGISEKAAVRDALRNATEQAAGVVIEAESQTRNYTLVKDRVRTWAEAFITNYELLGSTTLPDGTAQVRVRATISLGGIRDGVQALAILLARKHDPTFAVISLKNRGSSGDFEATAVAAVNAFLQNRLLRVVDPERVAALRSEDLIIQVAQTHRVSVAQEIANRLKADVYVTVEGHVERSASVNVRFFESSTGRLLGEQSAYGPAGDTALAAQKQAVEQATRQATANAFATLLTYWKRDTSQGSQLTVVANGLGFAAKTKFRHILGQVGREVKQLIATPGHAEFVVWSDDSVEEVVEQIYAAAEREKLGLSKNFDPHARGNRIIFTFE